MPFEMQKDIMYFRLSEEDEEDKRESNSISSQRACVEQYLHDRPELGSNFEEIVDDGYSGTSLDRPGMRSLLAMIKRNQVRTVIVRDLSRFARNLVDCISIIRMLKGLPKPVGVYFETDNLNTLGENNEFMLSFLATFAQEESVKKSEAMTSGTVLM